MTFRTAKEINVVQANFNIENIVEGDPENIQGNLKKPRLLWLVTKRLTELTCQRMKPFSPVIRISYKN